MAINDTVAFEQYTANGVSATFAFNHPFLTKNEIIVKQKDATTNAESTLVVDTDFTVSGTPDSNGHYLNGANIVITVMPSSGDIIAIERGTDYDQEAEYATAGEFPAEVHESALDKLTLIAQELQRQIDRAIKVTATSLTSELTFPSADDGKVIGWNGTDLVNKILASTDLVLPSFSGADNEVWVVNDAENSAEFKAISAILAEISTPAANNVLRRNAGNTAFEWGTLVTGGDGILLSGTNNNIVNVRIDSIDAVTPETDDEIVIADTSGGGSTKSCTIGDAVKTNDGVAKAWVRWNTITTTTITDSYNVTSLTDNGTGDTTINFTTAFANANYAWVDGTRNSAGNAPVVNGVDGGNLPATGAFRCRTHQGATAVDNATNSMAFFGDQ